ncbi:MAG: YdcF family protein [Gammaproteobacteria bacterium]|nr:MAG: YdcF family protein [Gammaproteobacteria bacterium]
MLYALTKSLVLPPVSLLLCLLLALIAWRRPWARGLAGSAIVLLLALSLPIVSHSLMAPLEPYPALLPNGLSDTGAQAIVVLAAGRYTDAPEYGGDSIGPISLQRVRYAAFVQRRTGLPLIVSGGSPAHQSPPIGRLMARVLQDELQAPVAGVEDQSLNTRENAAFTARLLHRRQLNRILLVSSAWHLPRAVREFERQGIEVIPAPTAFETRRHEQGLMAEDFLPGARSLMRSYLAIHEYLGRLWYWLKAS